MSDVKAPNDILAFWQAAGYEKWFNKDDAFDAAIRERFLPTYDAAAAGRLNDWAETPVWRSSSCSISFRVTCSAAAPSPGQQIRWPVT